MINASPIYPQTKDFPLFFVAEDEDSPVGFTAYGVTPGTEHGALCFYCDKEDPDVMCEHGMTGAPPEGIPVHLACLLGDAGWLLGPTAVALT